MELALWLLLYVANCAFALWVLQGTGAYWIQGWKAPFFLDWLFSFTWTDEQIKLYVLLAWVGHTIWFLLGAIIPEVRQI